MTGRRTAVALAVVAVAAIGVLAAVSGFNAPQVRLLSVVEEGVHVGPLPARPGEDASCARHTSCTVKAVFENQGETRAVVAVFTAHTYTATNAQGAVRPAGPDAQCSTPLPPSTSGQSVEVSCTLEAPPGIPTTFLDSPVVVSVRSGP